MCAVLLSASRWGVFDEWPTTSDPQGGTLVHLQQRYCGICQYADKTQTQMIDNGLYSSLIMALL